MAYRLSVWVLRLLVVESDESLDVFVYIYVRHIGRLFDVQNHNLGVTNVTAH